MSEYTVIEITPRVELGFWIRVPNRPLDGCWEWNSKMPGYGTFTCDGERCQAHILSYRIHYGEYDMMLNICHTCDNRKCVRPDHLFAAVQLKNVQDMISKGRQKPSAEVILLTCMSCGNIFERVKWEHNSKIKRGDHRTYCSRTCFNSTFGHKGGGDHNVIELNNYTIPDSRILITNVEERG